MVLPELLALLGVMRWVSSARGPSIICAPMGDAAFFQRSIAILYPCRLRPDISPRTRQLSRISSQVDEARMPSLSSFLRDLKPANRARQKSGDAAIIPRRVGVGTPGTDRLRPVADPKFAAGEQESVSSSTAAWPAQRRRSRSRPPIARRKPLCRAPGGAISFF